MNKLSEAFSRAWNSEDSRVSLRVKQLLATILPDRVLIAAKKRYYSQLLRQPDQSMESDAKALPKFVRSGGYVVDVGAFVGFYTKLLSSLVGPTGAVWSIEPVPETFEILAYNVKKLKMTNVELVNCAISDTEANVQMEVPKYRGGGESWYDARIVSTAPRSGLRKVNVVTRTLDSLLRDTPQPISFIKCDAEFHELHCIRGATETIRRCKPIFLIELLGNLDQPKSDQYRTIELLREFGYQPYFFDGGRFRLRQVGQQSQNLFFMMEQHRSVWAS